MKHLPCWPLLLLSAASLLLAVAPDAALAHTSAAPPAARAQPGPTFAFPSNGQSYKLGGTMLFQVQSLSGTMGYLWTFSQNGVIVWQNLDATGSLSGATMSVKGGSAAQHHMHPGPLQVRVRAEMKGGSWTSVSTITVQLTGGSPSGTKTPSGPTAPGVLYQANWSNGRDGWTLPQGWDTVSGELVNDGTGTDMTKHAQPPAIHPYTANYAVEADIQMVRPLNANCYGNSSNFGITVREESSGYYAVGLDDHNPNFGVSWKGIIADVPMPSPVTCDLSNNNLAGNSVSLDTNWHTYRVEVRGNDIKFLLDGNPVAETTDNHHLRSNVVGLWSDSIVLNVRSFKVIAL